MRKAIIIIATLLLLVSCTDSSTEERFVIKVVNHAGSGITCVLNGTENEAIGKGQTFIYRNPGTVTEIGFHTGFFDTDIAVDPSSHGMVFYISRERFDYQVY